MARNAYNEANAFYDATEEKTRQQDIKYALTCSVIAVLSFTPGITPGQRGEVQQRKSFTRVRDAVRRDTEEGGEFSDDGESIPTAFRHGTRQDPAVLSPLPPPDVDPDVAVLRLQGTLHRRSLPAVTQHCSTHRLDLLVALQLH
eukprot:767289-Hanusia_phi.AAC.3